MIKNAWLIINSKGSITIRQSKPSLKWNEIACKLTIQIPNELFVRPTIQANIIVADIPNTAYNPDVIINAKELIEQQTGAKIEFSVVDYRKEEPKQ